jgi:uncharacterized protein (DUF2267 family)
MTTVRAANLFHQTMEMTEQWIREVMEHLAIDDPRRGYRVFRATMHTLRDRLTMDEAVNLGAQLPMLVRGLYYEGWKPATTPQKLRNREQFFERLGRELCEPIDPDPEAACRAVFRVLNDHVTAGEIRDVKGMLPADVRDLWPR